jgi:glycosyltransferase involved in cell wall biosynthesis
MKISIIIPFIDRPDGNYRLFEIIKEANLEEIELILVSDSCSNYVLNKIRSIKKTRENLKLVEGKFGNPGSARNCGLELATGNWIGFWDSDDLPNVPEYIDMVRESALQGKTIAVGNYRSVSEASPNKYRIIDTSNGNLRNLFANVGLWRMAFRRDVLADKQFENLRMAEDQLFFASIRLDLNLILFSKKIVYTYFFGSPTHLTSNKVALGDLQTSNMLLEQTIAAGSGKENLLIMFLRQRLTMVVRGNLRMRIYSIFTLPKSIFRIRPKIPELLRAFSFVMKQYI